MSHLDIRIGFAFLSVSVTLQDVQMEGNHPEAPGCCFDFPILNSWLLIFIPFSLHSSPKMLLFKKNNRKFFRNYFGLFSITSMTNWQSDFISSNAWLWKIPFSFWWLFYIKMYDLGRNIFSFFFFVFCLLRFCGSVCAASFYDFHWSLSFHDFHKRYFGLYSCYHGVNPYSLPFLLIRANNSG